MSYVSRIQISLIFFLLLVLSACGGGGGETGPTPVVTNFSVDCSGSTTYSPSGAPVITLGNNGNATTTIILMHGKTGSPYAAFLLQLANELAAQNYDVIAPFMPWSGTDWDGTMCEGMLYITQLANAEIANGRNVVIMGHSMGAVHALIYDTITANADISAIIASAPGHLPHKSLLFQNDTAASIAVAEGMVASNMGDIIGTFDTRNNGSIIQITATANQYLSYHALDQFPDIDNVLPAIVTPVLFISGSADSLTTNLNHAQLFAAITSADSQYNIVTGSHISMVDNEAPVITDWLDSLRL